MRRLLLSVGWMRLRGVQVEVGEGDALERLWEREASGVKEVVFTKSWRSDEIVDSGLRERREFWTRSAIPHLLELFKRFPRAVRRE